MNPAEVDKSSIAMLMALVFAFLALVPAVSPASHLLIQQSKYDESSRLSDHLNNTDSGRLLKESGITIVRISSEDFSDAIVAYKTFPWLQRDTDLQLDARIYISMIIRLKNDRWAVYVDPEEVEHRSRFKYASENLDGAVREIYTAAMQQKAKEQRQVDTGENPSLKWSD